MRKSKSAPARPLNSSKRAAILAGARTVFLRDGFAGGAVDDVAAAAGVGKQTIYRHFGAKEGLVVALVEAMCAIEIASPPPLATRRERLAAQLRAFVAGLTGLESIRLYRAIVAEAERMPGLGRLFWDAGPRRIRAALSETWRETGDAAGAETAAAQLVQIALGDAYQERVLGVAEPSSDVFEAQIEAALRHVLK